MTDDGGTTLGANSIARLARLGARFTICKGKVPRARGWQHRGVDAGEATQWNHRGGNVGMLTGAASGGLVVIDLDDHADAFTARWPGLSALRVIRSNAPDRAKLILRVADGVPASTKLRRIDPDGKLRPYLELLARGSTDTAGCNAIAAGSFGGGDYVLVGSDPAVVTADELARVIRAWCAVFGDVRPPRNDVDASDDVGTTLGITPTGDILTDIDNACMARGGSKSGHNVIFRCPSHDDDEPSAGWTRKHGGKWGCFACGASGGWYDLARRLGIPTNPQMRARAVVARWRAHLDHPRPFGSCRNTATLRKLALVILDDISRSGQIGRVIGVRWLADLGGVGRGTAARALHVLYRLGLVRRVSESNGPRAAAYVLSGHTGTLSCPTCTAGEKSAPSAPEGATDQDSVPLWSPRDPQFLAADAWRYRSGLAGAWQVAADLQRAPMTTRELSAKYARSSVRRWLAALQFHGLVTQAAGGAWCATAAMHDLAGVHVEAVRRRRGDEQRRQHAREQMAWRAVVCIQTDDGDIVDRTTGEVFFETAGQHRATVADTITPTPPR